MKSYLVDTASSLVFFTVIAALSELLIAGMAPGQVLIARLIMIPVMLATSRPYGLWRDWVFARVQPARWISVGRIASWPHPISKLSSSICPAAPA